jgi:integrase
MFSKTPTGRSSKGSVSILSTHDRLQLRFNFGGKRHYLTLGLPDTIANRKLAQLKAAEIEKDILYERFDDTLEKYKPRSALSTIPPIPPLYPPKPRLDELWQKYSEFKKPQVSPSTYVKDFTRHRNHISRFPTQSLDEAAAIRDHLLATLTADAAKRCLTQLKACCDWAVEDGLIGGNPFISMKIKAPKGLGEDEDVNPFTKEERDRIIQAFEADRYYRHYAPYVRFLFFTGCRPSEAIALKWKHITSNVVRFRETVVISEEGLVLKQGCI